MKKYNLHTHTSRCCHAVGSDEQYVLCAVQAGFQTLGFSDHSPWPFESYVSGMRMTEDELDGYVQSVGRLREKYRGKIDIKLGLECEFFEGYMPWLEKQLYKHGFDYIILGHHYSPCEPGGTYNGCISTPWQLEEYTNGVLKAMDTGLFAYVAHPDLFMLGYPEFDLDCRRASDKIIDKAVQTGIPLEFNLLGLARSLASGCSGYPHEQFWQAAGEAAAPAVIGVDAHDPNALLNADLYNGAVKAASTYGVRLCEKVKLLTD